MSALLALVLAGDRSVRNLKLTDIMIFEAYSKTIEDSGTWFRAMQELGYLEGGITEDDFGESWRRMCDEGFTAISPILGVNYQGLKQFLFPSDEVGE